MTVKVTEAILERHMSTVDFLKGKEMSSIDPEKLMELATQAKESRFNMIKKVMDDDSVYARFVANISDAAAESIRIGIMMSLAKGGGLREVEEQIKFIMIDSLVFSYNILQDCISESWWERQVNKIEDKGATNENP
jgi:hypothetical protein